MKKPINISNNIWDNLKDKEKVFIAMLFSRCYTAEQIMKRLFIKPRQFRNYKSRITNLLKDD